MPSASVRWSGPEPGAVRAPKFVPAQELSGAFYTDVVRPLLGGRPHAAALIGWGSDVLGYDTERSTDHGWGPRLLVFVDSDDEIAAVDRFVTAGLPEEFRGWPVRFGWDAVLVSDHVTVTTLGRWLTGELGVDATAGWSFLDWLLTPQQRLLGIVAGAVYADDTGALTALRQALSWYPDQIARWLLACQWHRLAQEEALVARTAEVGDGTGSAVTAARLVRDIMRLGLMLRKRYAPYQKWLGTAFGRAGPDDDLPAQLDVVTRAVRISDRENALAAAYTALAGRHNRTGLTAPVDPAVRGYYQRPARVLMADRFTQACLATVTEPALLTLPLIGGIDQVVDSGDVLQSPASCRRLAPLYAAIDPSPGG